MIIFPCWGMELDRLSNQIRGMIVFLLNPTRYANRADQITKFKTSVMFTRHGGSEHKVTREYGNRCWLRWNIIIPQTWFERRLTTMRSMPQQVNIMYSHMSLNKLDFRV